MIRSLRMHLKARWTSETPCGAAATVLVESGFGCRLEKLWRSTWHRLDLTGVFRADCTLEAQNSASPVNDWNSVGEFALKGLNMQPVLDDLTV